MRQVIKGLDYTTRDYEGFRQLMINKLKELMPEYTDLRQSDAGVVILELNAMCLDILSYYLDSIANECFLVTAEQRSNILKFCKMLGYTPRYATAAHYKQEFISVDNYDNKEEFIIPVGTKVKTYSSIQENVVYFTVVANEGFEDFRRADKHHSNPYYKGVLVTEDEQGNPVTPYYRCYADVIHGLPVNNEILISGLTQETPNQAYSLNYAPALIDSTFKVYVDEGKGFEPWERVNTFAGSDSDSKVYMVENNDYNETSVVFGNGIFGKIPTGSITCSYFVGGGESGNVGIGAIKDMETALSYVKETRNVEQISHGYDNETLEEIKINAPIAHRNIWGALTTDDYAGVVKTYFPDIKDAEAQKASEDWTLPEVDDINIYLLTNAEIEYQSGSQQDGKEDEKPLFKEFPDEFKVDPHDYSTYDKVPVFNNIIEFFNSNVSYTSIESGTLDTGRKLSGTRGIYLFNPNYAPITLKYTLMARNYYDPESIAEELEKYLKNYFFIGNIPFGQIVSFQDLAYDIIDNSGIEGIRFLSFDISGETKDENEEIHTNTYDYVNKDLIIPKIGTIIVLGGFERDLKSSPNTDVGGGDITWQRNMRGTI